MPVIYLSPSTRANNDYVTEGTEADWMNRLADALEPALTASGIQVVRSTPDMTTDAAISAANYGNYDLYLALHSNCAPAAQDGSQRGILVYYYSGSKEVQKAAEMIADNLKMIYPLSNHVRTLGSSAIGEIRRVCAPVIILKLGYHDNRDDAVWIMNHLDPIARNLVLSLTEYFNLPFLSPHPLRTAVVDLNWGALNLHDRPHLSAPIMARAYDGAKLTVLNQWQNWYLVRFNGALGWANSNFVTILLP